MTRHAVTTAIALLIASCAAVSDGLPTPSPDLTGDFRQGKLDIAYTFLSGTSVHSPGSKQLLNGALEAMRQDVRSAGGSADIATPDFTTDAATSSGDFKKFAAAAGLLAAKNQKNPGVTADRLADAGIVGMIRADPDCHTYYRRANGTVSASRPASSRGTGPQIPPGGTAIQAQPDQAGLQATLLPGGVAYLTWHAFTINGTYSITDAVRAILDRSVASGAKAWLFDLRGNIGGNGGDFMASWFLDGERTLTVLVRTGDAGTQTANLDLRLVPAYQLPIAIILNDRAGSAPEVFAASLRENHRATIVGSLSMGCLGGEIDAPLGSDGSRLYVVKQEYVGAVSGAHYNNVGIPPDVPAVDTAAVAVATELLLRQIAGR